MSRALHLRALCKSRRPFSSSSSFSSQTHLVKKQSRNQNQFTADDVRIHHKFKEAIEKLCQLKHLKEAVQLLEQHIQYPSATIYSKLLHVCTQQRALGEGKRIHNHIKNYNFKPGVAIGNKLLELYCKCESIDNAQKLFDQLGDRDLCSWNIMISGYARIGQIDEARKLFDKMPERDNFSRTAMISGYVRDGKPKEALEMYRLMQRDGNFESSKFTISSALAASSSIQSLRLGKEIHGHIVRTGLLSDAVVWSSLSDMYGRCGSMREARHIFDKTSEKDVVSWTAMIDRCFGDGKWEDGFLLFSHMMESRVRPNEFTFAGVLNACTVQTTEVLGRQVHGYMMRIGFDPSSFAATALVHMYSKCGNMDNACKVFRGLQKPDLVSWTSLINGFAQNGRPHEALRFFELLLQSGIQPDHITFVGVLSACSHAGLVDKGLEYFYSIKEKHGLPHTADHYACVVDLLSRSGRFRAAEDMISTMPMKPDKFLWASLLGGCRIHGNLELAQQAAEALIEIEPENAATYVTLANIYANAGRWREEANVRKMMDEKGVIKKPGMSWINVKRKFHVFLVGDESHPGAKEIYNFLGELWRRMKAEGYIPDTDYVLHDVEEEQKEENLSYHSEKLAVAFGIISTPQGTPIKVFKNLRTCVDCHTAMKFISKITDRRITIRDSSRFHYFEGGTCSCNDYW